MAEPCVVNVFGCPTVHTAGGVEIRFRTKKQLGLFVYLALETKERAVSRDRLVELFWSDTDPAKGRHSLSQAFSAMRERFGADALTRGRGPVTLLIPVETELDQIERQGMSAQNLLRPLDDLECAGGITFSHWVDATRHAINLRAKTVLETALATAAKRGRVDRVREHAAQLYRVDPLNSSAVNALTDQLLEQGDQVGAMQLLQEHAKEVGHVIGNTPPEIDRRIGRIRKEMEVRVPPREPTFDACPDVFVGRGDEIAELEVQWAEALLRQCRRGGGVRPSWRGEIGLTSPLYPHDSRTSLAGLRDLVPRDWCPHSLRGHLRVDTGLDAGSWRRRHRPDLACRGQPRVARAAGSVPRYPGSTNGASGSGAPSRG